MVVNEVNIFLNISGWNYDEDDFSFLKIVLDKVNGNLVLLAEKSKVLRQGAFIEQVIWVSQE